MSFFIFLNPLPSYVQIFLLLYCFSLILLLGLSSVVFFLYFSFISRGNTIWNSSQALFWLYVTILPKNTLWYLLYVLNYTISNLLFISLCKLLNFHLTLWFWNLFICIDMVTLFGIPSMKVP